jgi:hypothetical protein
MQKEMNYNSFPKASSQNILVFVDCTYDGENGKVRNPETPCGEQ